MTGLDHWRALLGVRDAPDWDAAVYDRFWIITFNDAGAVLNDLPQDLI